eukprot:CAMPEP_0177633238 /NCGR_PEP_ID=MMETSP0447-20121125/2730_1 /TAXON_ID=0 /ORGANISM="Stygamoeba regulata, Strain BSH-02190019" /LENGTH=925 /DNA_ID=CAMNT_0019134883 /DNA_START=1 /DNA_END=2778 /DNA_ORIENTATION=-
MAQSQKRSTQQQAAPKETGHGIVKSVNSGDTIVLFQLNRNGQVIIPPCEREITLTSIQAPRMGRPATKSREAVHDEPYAWESREFLRRLVVGKIVSYTVESKNPNTGREYGQVQLGGESVNSAIVAAGFARVKSGNSAEPRKSDVELIELQNAAEAEKKGLWEKDDAAHVRTFEPVDSYELYTRLRGKLQTAVVEQVRSASLLRVSFLPSKQVVSLQLGGAIAPRTPFPGEDNSEPEPFAAEAKFLAERNLLQRDVHILFTGVDKQQNFFGKVVDSASGRSLANELISQGLAQYVEWSAPTEDRETLLSLQNAAKEKGLRIWSKKGPSAAEVAASKPEAAAAPTPASTAAPAKVVAPALMPPAATPPAEFVGRVREVKSGGDLIVADTADRRKYFVSLASVQVPRTGPPGKDDEPWAFEAREFMRSKLVGKKVRVTLDYTRPANKERNLTEKAFCSVFLDKSNIASMLIEKGLAKVMGHRGDDPRSPHYEALVMCEMKAKKKRKGVFGDADAAPKHHVNDLTNVAGPGRTAPEGVKLVDVGKLKNHLPFLQRGGKLEALVEYVFSGTRFKLFIPRESCLINFSVAGLKAPAKRGNLDEPFAEESVEFARELLLQQTVEIEVENIDKGGNFLGNMWCNRKNVGISMLEEGCCSVNFGPRKHLYAHEYVQAEESAKARRLGMWENWDPNAVPAVDETGKEEGAPSKEFYTVKIVEVCNGSRFYATKVDDLPGLESLMKRIEDLNPDAINPGAVSSGSIALGKFTADNAWYRVKVLKVNREKTSYEVAYIDYGGSETIPSSRIRPLPIGFPSPPAMAKECVLAYVKVPELSEDFGVEAAEFLRDTIMDNTMVVNIEYREGDKSFVTLVDVDTKRLINTLMVEQGLATVVQQRKKHLAPLIEKMNEAQEKARSGRMNLWQYGDILEDDE